MTRYEILGSFDSDILTSLFYLYINFMSSRSIIYMSRIRKIQNISQLYQEIHKYSPLFYPNQLTLNHRFEIDSTCIQAEMMHGF